MKCIETKGKITRVDDETAAAAVATGKSKFVPKSAWKAFNAKDLADQVAKSKLAEAAKVKLAATKEKANAG
jgi:hypothetical protein